ncbi:MAG: hypothetical protein K9K64_01825 [Desulfohalobiaceae bacterium]|nr:hypothetical protein [Desulfohalobiaceae bacterium]
MIRKIFKVLFWIVGLLALGLFSFWLVRFRGWPWWAGASVGLGGLAVFFGVVYLKRFLLRRREKKFVQQVIAQDDAAIAMASSRDRSGLRELQEKWKEAVDLLKNSQLKKQGNPLYVLPWYLVLGEPGSGKSTAIKSSNLNSPITEVRKQAGIAGTRNFDWWFFNEAIILDTAGRYSVPVNEDMDREEWESFLTLLARYRVKEPLNGLILTVSADELSANDQENLYLCGQSLRKRIDQLMRVCAAKFPVYILVTKADLIHGLAPFSEMLPEGSLEQAMGYSVDYERSGWEEALEDAFSIIANRLKELRILLVQQEEDPDPSILLFPDEFTKVKKGLFQFAKGVFEKNPYQKDPLFRGIYFASGCQQGQPYSEFLERFQISGIKNELRGKNSNKIFLHDFFKRILPRDRNIYSPIAEYLKWHRITSRLGFLTWVLIWCSLAGLVGYSGWKNLDVMKTYASEYQNVPEMGKDVSLNLLALNQFRLQIEDLIQKNRNWYVPRFGLRQTDAVEKQMINDYLQLFQKGFLGNMDKKLEKSITEINGDTSEDVIAGYVSHIAARIRTMQAYLKGKHLGGSGDLSEITGNILNLLNPEMLQEVGIKFGDVYYSYLNWQRDPGQVQDKIKKLQVSLERIIDKKGTGLRWLVYKYIPDVEAVGLEQFWGRAAGEKYKNMRIEPAFTRQGRKHLQEYLQEVSATVVDKQAFQARQRDFWKWYEQTYLQKWYLLASDMSQGRNALAHHEQWKAMARKMTTPSNPYFEFIWVMADNLKVLDELPEWARAVVELNKAKDVDYVGKKEEEKSLLDKLKSKGAGVVQKTLEYTSKEDLNVLKNRIEMAKTWNKYSDSFQELSPVTQTSQKAYRLTSGFFSQDLQQAEQGSPFFTVRDRLFHLQNKMVNFFKGEASLINGVLKGPFDFLVYYATMDAACILQKKWEEDVLAGIQGVSKARVPYVLFEPDKGAVWDFLKGPAAPFIGRNQNGFYPSAALGSSLPFFHSFFIFLTQGAEGTVEVKSEYTVQVKALPIDGSQEARINPYGCVLSLQCAGKKTRLKNLNYPAEQIFNWNLDSCGDVALEIFLPNTSLHKFYKGKMGFAEFLRDFRDGTRIFGPGDFPGQAEYLQENGLEEIRVSFNINGAEPVMELLREVPQKIPQEIVTCWH